MNNYVPIPGFMSDVDPTLLDPDTGLRKLPRGYFFRFRLAPNGALVAEIRKKTFLGSKQINRKMSLYENSRKYNSPQHRMRYLSSSAVDVCYDSDFIKAMQPLTQSKLIAFLGDYPPKKLS